MISKPEFGLVAHSTRKPGFISSTQNLKKKLFTGLSPIPGYFWGIFPPCLSAKGGLASAGEHLGQMVARRAFFMFSGTNSAGTNDK
jgi:hypothetical protein